MVKTLENNRKIKSTTKSKDLGKTNINIPSKSQKSKLAWANDVAINANLTQIRAFL